MKNQFGRSMLEMLGVLGLIGLLSIAGVEGYQYAVLRHRSNVVLKMAHQIAADIFNLPRMYQQTATLAESEELADLDFTNKSGMTLPFAEGNMTATKIDGTVFRVNTPPLSEEQCQAVLKYARNYPLILEKTFEEENCIGEEENRVGLLYFSLDYGANDLNPTPETPPAGCPTLIEPIREECVTHPLLIDDNGCQYYDQAQCTPGTCETSDGQKGECSNCACIPDNPVEPPEDGPVACEPACSDGYCCIRTALGELLCLEDGSTNGQTCEGFNDTSCPTNYACRELDGAFKCVLDCDSTSTGGGVAGGSVAGGGVTGGGAAGGVVSCSPDKDKEKTLKLYGKEWTVKSNEDCEKSTDYGCAICPLAGYCSRYSMSTPNGCGCPDNVYYWTGRDRRCCVDGDGNVGQVPDKRRYEYCYPSKAVSGFWCRDTAGSLQGFCCPKGAKVIDPGETPISKTIQSGDGNLYYSLEYCVCPENTVFNPAANNGYGACVECIEEGYISDGKGHCCNPNDNYLSSGCLCTPDYLKYKCEKDKKYCGWEEGISERWLFVDSEDVVRFSDGSRMEGTCATCSGDGTWCGGLPSGCCPCYDLSYEGGQRVNEGGKCNYCPKEYISTSEELTGKVYNDRNPSGICLKCAEYGGVWHSGSGDENSHGYTMDSYCIFCPEDKPMWDGDSCEPCPDQTPKWDGNGCVTCYQYKAETPYWNYDSKKCEECPEKTYWNGYDSCVTCYEYGGETPYWNDVSEQCEKCPEDNPMWNDDLKQCEPCPVGSVYNSGSCIGDPSAFCPEEAGYYWDYSLDCCWNPYMGSCEY